MEGTPFKIVHHHAYKCAGSTLMWILERNFPGRVLYIEGRASNQRIFCEDAVRIADGEDYRAVSSHLLCIPDVGKNIGSVHVSFLRDPVQRLLSAYRFEKASGRVPSDTTLETYCKVSFQANNFQIRHSSVHHRDDGQGGWDINRKIFDKIDAGEIFFGLVEHFDDSLIALERLLRQKGVHFDAAYPAAMNKTSGPARRANASDVAVKDMLAEKNAPEFELYETAKQHFLEDYENRITWFQRLGFHRRCRSLRNSAEAKTVTVPPNRDWTYVDN